MPPTSVLMMMFRSLTSPSLACSWNCSSVRRRALCHRRIAGLGLAIHDDLLCLARIADHLECVADIRQSIQTDHLNRSRRTGFAHLLAGIVVHGADLAEYLTADEVSRRHAAYRF